VDRANVVAHVGIGRGKHFACGQVGDDFARRKKDHALSEVERLIEVVGNEQNRLTDTREQSRAAWSASQLE
jgi:hypothetical protein